MEPPTSNVRPAAPGLVVAITQIPSVIVAGESEPYGATARGGTTPYTEYVWTFGDGYAYFGPQAEVNHTYEVAGRFVITVTVTDRSGATAAASAQLSVNGSGSDPPAPVVPVRILDPERTQMMWVEEVLVTVIATLIVSVDYLSISLVRLRFARGTGRRRRLRATPRPGD